MKSKKELIKYIRHLLNTDKTLSPDIRRALRMAVKALHQPGPVNIDHVIKISEILVTGLSVGMELYKHLHT